MSNMSSSTPPTAQADSGHGRAAKALLLSPDFLVGVPLGLGIGVLPALIPALLVNGFAFMATLAAISAGIAALVLTPMALLLGVFNPAFKSVLAKTPGGVAGTFVPFAQVALIAAGACVASLVVAILTPLAAGTFPVVIWIAVGVPVALFLWAVIGCAQVTVYLVGMVRAAQTTEALQTRIDVARAARDKRVS